MPETLRCEVAVVGLGAMGAATLLQLAKNGVKAVGIDQFAPPHSFGSTHGETRITRLAIGEGAQFVPLAVRSHQLWREIEAQTGQSLLHACGGLIIAKRGQHSAMHEQQDFLGTTFATAVQYGIPHESLDAEEIARRYPQFVLDGDEVAYFEPSAGYVKPEACVRTQLSLAEALGATLRCGERVEGIQSQVVRTSSATIVAERIVVCAGAWLPQLVPSLSQRLTVRRQVLHWFAHDGSGSYRENDFPIFIWHWGASESETFYGFPQVGEAAEIKVATEQRDHSTTADEVDRNVSAEEQTTMHDVHVAGRLRGLTASTRSATCLYTNAPRANFLIDRLPNDANTVIVSACSGHGFKHSAAIGEAVAQMIVRNETPAVLMPFSMAANGLG